MNFLKEKKNTMNVLICAKCRGIICDCSKIVSPPENPFFLGLKFVPHTVVEKQESEPIFTQNGIDAYCFFYDLFCRDCSLQIGKKYITFNNFLLKNEIQASMEKTNVQIIELDFSYLGKKILIGENTQNNEFAQNNNFAEVENKFVKAMDVKENIFGLPGFINSERILQTTRMKRFLLRISFLEEMIDNVLFPKIIELLNK